MHGRAVYVLGIGEFLVIGLMRKEHICSPICCECYLRWINLRFICCWRQRRASVVNANEGRLWTNTQPINTITLHRLATVQMVLIVPNSLWKVTITDRVGKCQQLSAVAGRWRQRVISRYDDDYNEYLFASLSFDLTINYEFSNENQVTAVLMNRVLGMHNKGVNVITPLLQQSDWKSDRHINGATYAQEIVKVNQLQRNGSCFFK